MTEAIFPAPAVSICIPTYNRPRELRAAIQSCLDQTFQDFEVVVSDNSEHDENQRYLDEMQDPRIRYFRNRENIGGIRNLAIAVDRARGRYIKLLMDDDLLRPHALERMISAFEANPSAGVVMAPLDIIDPKGNQVNRRLYLIKKASALYRYMKRDCLVPGTTILRDFMTRIYPCCVPSGVMYKKECFDRLGNFDLTMKFAVDVDICMRFATAYDFYYLDEVLASWRYSPKSDTVKLHHQGLYNEEFYYLAEKYANDRKVLALFPTHQHACLRREAFFFATKRCVLSILAGAKSGNLGLIRDTLGLMLRRDPYRTNFVRLPFNLAGEVGHAIVSWLR